MVKKAKGIAYYGGKQKIARRIVELLPPHNGYVEPFCGGSAVLFAKGRCPNPNEFNREVINDKDEHLIILYKELQSNPALIHKLKWTLYSKTEHTKAWVILKDKTASREDIAWAMFVRLAMSFGYVPHAGWGRSACGSSKSKVWANKVVSIELLHERLKDVYIENDDALSIIRNWDAPHTCFYVDPPYPNTDQGDYKGYSIEDYQTLIDTLIECQGSFVLSGYAQGIEPEEWQRVDIKTRCHVSGQGTTGNGQDRSHKSTNLGNRKRVESLWIVDRSHHSRKDIKKYLWSPSKGHVYREQEPTPELEQLPSKPTDSSESFAAELHSAIQRRLTPEIKEVDTLLELFPGVYS